MIEPSFWAGRRVLVTGHTGFKGAWLALWLELLGAEVHGFALAPAGAHGAHGALHRPAWNERLGDIRDRALVRDQVEACRPDVVFHLAAQALVRAGYQDPVGTYETNVLGTVNTLDAASACGVRAVVVVTSDKVYANDGAGRPFKESDPLGGRDPYSSSKACADLAAQAWRSLDSSADTAIGIARAGNVIGGGDDAEDRLLPDAWRAAQHRATLELRHPDAIRPWQFVLEPLSGYLLLAARLISDPSSAPVELNFGPELDSCRAVHEVVDLAYERLGHGTWRTSADRHPGEAAVLRLDAARARDALGWRPRLGLAEAVEWTVSWWRRASAGEDLRRLAIEQIETYESLG